MFNTRGFVVGKINDHMRDNIRENINDNRDENIYKYKANIDFKSIGLVKFIISCCSIHAK